jgi:hypothetical protein
MAVHPAASLTGLARWSSQGCNVWVYCASAQGCAGELRKFRQCWLKASQGGPQAKPGDASGWISGARQAYY